MWRIPSCFRCSPLIAGYIYSITGHYSAAFILSAGLNIAALLLLLLLKKPTPVK